MRTSTNGCLSWGAAVRIRGEDGSDGSDGSTGPTGNSAVTIYVVAATQPGAPTGNNPAGWSTSIPSGVGAVWASSGTKNSSGVLTSSRTLKRNIRPMASGATARMLQLPSVRWEWREGSNHPAGTEDIGFIAEDVAAMLPECARLDEGGKPEGVKPMKFIPLLVEALREERAARLNIESRLTALEKQVEAMERKP